MIERLRDEIERRLKWHHNGQRQWSFVHHTTTAGATILSLVVVAISQVKLERIDKDLLIAGLSFGAAVLAALASKGGFERKWIANRMTRSKLEALQLDTLDDNADTSAMKETLKCIIAEHDAAITGSKL